MNEAAATPSLRLYGKWDSVAVALLDGAGRERIWHFVPYKSDDPVGLIFSELAVAGHILTFGARPITGEVVREKPLDAREKFKWTVDLPITRAAYDAAYAYADNDPKGWEQYQMYGRNCISFVGTVAEKAEVDLPKLDLRIPSALVMGLRGRIRSGRMKALRGKLPRGIFKGGLPADVLKPA